MATVSTKVRMIDGPLDETERPPVTLPLSDAAKLVAANKARIVICRVTITGNVTPYNVGETIGRPYHQARQLIDSDAAKPHPDDADLLDYVEPEKPDDQDVVREVNGVELPSMEQVMARGYGVEAAKKIVKRQGLLSRYVGEGMTLGEAEAKIDADNETAAEKAEADGDTKEEKRIANESAKPASSRTPDDPDKPTDQRPKRRGRGRR